MSYREKLITAVKKREERSIPEKIKTQLKHESITDKITRTVGGMQAWNDKRRQQELANLKRDAEAARYRTQIAQQRAKQERAMHGTHDQLAAFDIWGGTAAGGRAKTRHQHPKKTRKIKKTRSKSTQRRIVIYG